GLLTAAGDTDDPEHVEAFDVRAVHPGHPEVVVDHQNPDGVGIHGPGQPSPRTAHRSHSVPAPSHHATTPPATSNKTPRSRPSWPPPAAGKRDVHHRPTTADAMTTTSIGSARTTAR